MHLCVVAAHLFLVAGQDVGLKLVVGLDHFDGVAGALYVGAAAFGR